MNKPAPVRAGQTLVGPLFNEPMRVETEAAAGNSSWVVGLVSAQSERFLRVTMSEAGLASIAIRDAEIAFDATAFSFASASRVIRWESLTSLTLGTSIPWRSHV